MECVDSAYGFAPGSSQDAQGFCPSIRLIAGNSTSCYQVRQTAPERHPAGIGTELLLQTAFLRLGGVRISGAVALSGRAGLWWATGGVHH